jgi:signal peptidase I
VTSTTSDNNQQGSYYLAPTAPTKTQLVVKKSSKLVFNIIQIVVGLSIFGILMYFFVTPVNMVDGPSMQPNFCNKDIYLTFKLGYFINPMGYQHDQVIAFKENATTNLIKRVIGIPGDVLTIQEGKVYRNGVLLNEVYLPAGRLTYPLDKTFIEGVDYTVPQGKYIVFGDNRGNSIDSRDLGAIDPYVNTINGNVFAVLWPPQRMRIFDTQHANAENTCDGTLNNGK